LKAGDPFETKDLDELRTRQRHTLRLIPDVLLENYAPKTPVQATSRDTGMLERELRAMADALQGEELTDLPERWGDRTRSAVVFEFMDRAAGQVTLQYPGRVQKHVFSDTVESMRRQVEDSVTTELAAEVASVVMRFLHLLVWADNLAADGYRDPRLSELRSD
jgi:hypothetical protein